MKDYVLSLTLEMIGKNLPEQQWKLYFPPVLPLNHATIHKEIVEWPSGAFRQHVNFPPTGRDPATWIRSPVNLC